MQAVKDATATIAVKDAMATIAVRDTEAARKFYEGKVGLELVSDEMMPEAVVLKSGGSKVLVYRSQYAGSNKATAATWGVGNDLEKIVKELKAKGVSFEHYDLPGIIHKGDVHVGGGPDAAWFKDPDGNILALVSG
jgi:catechol 2,3-dioxygenase-like lactoylglutathione lyase family enzyme